MDKIIEYLYQENNINNIDKILEYLIEYFNLEDFINNINIKSTSSSKYGKDDIIRTASYNFDSKDIYFYKDGVKRKIAYMIRKYLMYSDKDINIYRNIIILRIILHELEHANQNRVLYTGNSFSHEKKIIEIYNRFNIIYLYNRIKVSGCKDTLIAYELAKKKYIDVYKDMYDCDPIERVANIRSVNKTLEILNVIESNELIYFENKQLEFFYKRGYVFKDNEVLSPINEYIKVTGINDINDISWYDKDESKSLTKVLERYNYQERLLYGMPLSQEEYNNL